MIVVKKESLPTPTPPNAQCEPWRALYRQLLHPSSPTLLVLSYPTHTHTHTRAYTHTHTRLQKLLLWDYERYSQTLSALHHYIQKALIEVTWGFPRVFFAFLLTDWQRFYIINMVKRSWNPAMLSQWPLKIVKVRESRVLEYRPLVRPLEHLHHHKHWVVVNVSCWWANTGWLTHSRSGLCGT